MLGAIGRIGSLFNRLPGANALPQVLRGAPATRGGQLFRGLMSAENASLGLGGLLYGSQKAQDILGRSGFIPTQDDLRRRSEGIGKQGKNYTVGGIEYDFRTGRPINPPISTFIPYEENTLQAGQFTPPPPSLPGAPPAPGAVSNGAGVPAQRQNVQQRQISQDVLNAAQQYAAPASVPLSSFYEGQQQLGRRMEQGGELQRQLRDLGGAAGMSDQALMDWAKANPGLAYRELMKLRGRNQ